MGTLQSDITLIILRCKLKILSGQILGLILSVCPYKNYVPKHFQKPHDLFPKFFYLVCINLGGGGGLKTPLPPIFLPNMGM